MSYSSLYVTLTIGLLLSRYIATEVELGESLSQRPFRMRLRFVSI